MWKIAVSGYGNPLTLLIFPLGADVAILFTAITGALVGVRSFLKFDGCFDIACTQSSFAFRLWKLSKKLTLPLISLALCLLAQSIALTMTVTAFAMTNLVKFETDGNRLITLSFTSRLVCELTLTLSMVWYLKRQRSSIFSRHVSLLPIRSLVMVYRTTTIIDRLVLWTLGEHCAFWHHADMTHLFNHLTETGLITRYVARRSWCVGADIMLSLVVVFDMSFVRDPFSGLQH
jgi:hypothetical protein